MSAPATTAQRVFEDVRVGDVIGRNIHETSKTQLLAYATVSRDINLIHHDPDYAREVGLPDTIIHGSLKSGLLAGLLQEFVGARGMLRSLTVQYRGIDVPGEPLIATGVIEAIERDTGLIECRVWLESPTGTTNTRGTATVSLPRRPG
jgi:acyl dehydratase